MPGARPHHVLAVLVFVAGCGAHAAAKAPGDAATTPAGRTETVTKGYYAFTVPASWSRTDAPSMQMHEPTWQLPRPNGTEPVVPLKHHRITVSDHGEKAGTDPVRETIDDWKKRWGAITVAERTQSIAGAEKPAEAKVFLVEQAKDGRAVLAALVDLSAVDARTRSAYSRVGFALFELEGPEAAVLAARTEFDALVRSVHLAD